METSLNTAIFVNSATYFGTSPEKEGEGGYYLPIQDQKCDQQMARTLGGKCRSVCQIVRIADATLPSGLPFSFLPCAKSTFSVTAQQVKAHVDSTAKMEKRASSLNCESPNLVPNVVTRSTDPVP